MLPAIAWWHGILEPILLYLGKLSGSSIWRRPNILQVYVWFWTGCCNIELLNYLLL